MKIFISYSSKTRPIVETLAESLKVIDHEVWFDEELVRDGGHPWWNLILQEIRNCDVFIYALTAQSVKSPACNKEYDYAVALRRVIVPVIMTDDVIVTQLPIALQSLEMVDYRQQTFKQLRNLKDSLKNQRPNPLPAVPPPEPDPPFAPLVQINNRLLARQIDTDNQWDLAGDLERLIIEGDDPVETMRLLIVFQARADLNAHVSRKLDRLRGDHPAQAVEPRLSDPPSARQPTPATHIPFAQFQAPPVAPTANPTAGTIRKDAKGIEQVYVPAGTFLMGSPDGQGYDDKRPQHSQTIAEPFWLDRTPITNAQYAQFVKEGGYEKEAYWTPAGWAWVRKNGRKAPSHYPDRSSAPNQPRVGVTWFEATAYAKWRGGRLPTEAEWEWAARGAQSLIYPWGNSFDGTKVVYSDNANGKTAPVDRTDRIAASWCGALDMGGNVWEWCSSLSVPYPYVADDSHETLINENDARVLRGSSWYYDQDSVRAACRNYFRPDNDNSYVGLRVCGRPPLRSF